MNKKAQNVSEYAIIIGLISSILLVMSVYFQRGLQVVIKEPVDNLGGFGSGMFSAERIQEIGIEDKANPVPGFQDFTKSEENVDNIRVITTSKDGKRVLTVDDKMDIPNQTNKDFQKTEYDQISE